MIFLPSGYVTVTGTVYSPGVLFGMYLGLSTVTIGVPFELG